MYGVYSQKCLYHHHIITIIYTITIIIINTIIIIFNTIMITIINNIIIIININIIAINITYITNKLCNQCLNKWANIDTQFVLTVPLFVLGQLLNLRSYLLLSPFSLLSLVPLRLFLHQSFSFCTEPFSCKWQSDCIGQYREQAPGYVMSGLF